MLPSYKEGGYLRSLSGLTTVIIPYTIRLVENCLHQTLYKSQGIWLRAQLQLGVRKP
jgi:hypothetical protein